MNETIVKCLCVTILTLAVMGFTLVCIWSGIYYLEDPKAFCLMVDKILVQTKVPKRIWGILWLSIVVLVFKILISKPLKQEMEANNGNLAGMPVLASKAVDS
jgi:hypothetical protein